MLTFNNEQLRSKIKTDLGVDVPADKDFLPFSNVEQSVRDDVAAVRASPLVAPGTAVFGHVYDVKDGTIKPVDAN
jgi:carbonic anhydrase